MSRITLTLETSLALALRNAAEKDDRSMSSVARLALAKHFGLRSKSSKKKGAK